LILLSSHECFAINSINQNVQLSLAEREEVWPNWKLPGPFKGKVVLEDLIYPKYFLGNWVVESFDLEDEKSEILKYPVKFRLNQKGEVVGDRAFNANSIAKEIFGEKLKYVEDDPNSSNRQLAVFEDRNFLETKIIGREEQFLPNSFISDELSLQIFHSAKTRITQVETLSKYSKCNESRINSNNYSSNDICGEQWQIVYKGPGENISQEPLRKYHFKLLLHSPL